MDKNVEKRICLNQSVLDFMESCIDDKSTVLEIGGGWSSRWFGERCGHLQVVETSLRWAEVVTESLIGISARWDVLCAKGRPPVASLMYLRRSLSPDLILVDCEEKHRTSCMEVSKDMLKPGGWLVFDDAQRSKHRVAIQSMEEDTRFGPATRLEWAEGDIETAKERLALAWRKES